MVIYPRRRVYILFFTFIFSIFQFGLLLHLLMMHPKGARPPDPAAMRPFLYGIAGLALLLAVAQAWLRMPLASTTFRVQTAMIIALAFAEVCCLMGMLLFFLGGTVGEAYRFLAATLLIDLLFILPQVGRRV